MKKPLEQQIREAEKDSMLTMEGTIRYIKLLEKQVRELKKESKGLKRALLIPKCQRDYLDSLSRR